MCVRDIQLHKSNWNFNVFRVKLKNDILNFSSFWID